MCLKLEDFSIFEVMGRLVAYILFSLFVSFTVMSSTYSFWGDQDNEIAFSITEEEEEEDGSTNTSFEEEREILLSNHEKLDYFYVETIYQKLHFSFMQNKYDPVYLQLIFSPPDELLT